MRPRADARGGSAGTSVSGSFASYVMRPECGRSAIGRLSRRYSSFVGTWFPLEKALWLDPARRTLAARIDRPPPALRLHPGEAIRARSCEVEGIIPCMRADTQERGGNDDPAPLIETKLVPPRARPNILVRIRLERLLDRSASAALTLVDAPVGFGKTMLAQSWCAQPVGRGRVGVARCRRRRSGALLDVSRDCRRPRQAGPRADGTAQAAHARRLDHGRRRRARERARRLRGAGRHRARRSPRPLERGELRLARVRSGAPPVQRPRHRDHARRPARRPGQAARSRHARRDPLARARVHGRGGARIPGRRRGNGARRRRRRATRRAHRGLARRPLPGGALAARARRSRRGRARLRTAITVTSPST